MIDIPGETLLQALEARAHTSPDRAAAWFETQPLSYGALWTSILQAAGAMTAVGVVAGARVVVALPNGLEFFPAFYGAQAAGGVAVPLFPAYSPRRLVEYANRCDARAIVVPDDRRAEVAAEVVYPVLSPTMLEAATPAARPASAPRDIAYLQYTSGSTGEPKGVAITQGALITNIRQLIAGMEITPAERFVSWVPVYHDMGLILKTMTPMAIGAETYLLPTSLTDIDHWLETIERVRGTFTAAPDFAWRLAVRRPLARRYDLSSLRVAIDAAEPVRASTLSDVEAKLGLRDVMAAGYGLAEATVGVSMTKPGRAPKVDAAGAVSLGRPFPGVEIEIRRGDKPLPAGVAGDVWVRTTAASEGYFQDPAATAALFDRRGFLTTGDVGYVDSDGELFFLSRAKHSIVVAGRTIAPREVEEAAEASGDVRMEIGRAHV